MKTPMPEDLDGSAGAVWVDKHVRKKIREFQKMGYTKQAMKETAQRMGQDLAAKGDPLARVVPYLLARIDDLDVA